MPYTPPAQQSPASSKPTTPTLSRSSSYHEDGPRPTSIGRPSPPRSMSSSSYLHRHRRTPSVTKVEDVQHTSTESGEPKISTTDFAQMNSIRQSPPPVNNLRIPTGAVLSPPDSAESSDDGSDQSANNERSERGRELEKNWDALQQAVSLIDQRREGSPDKTGKPLTRQTQSKSHTESEPHSQTTSPSALTAEARKISHSRSSTESGILKPTRHFESPTQGSDDSEEDEEDMSKPSLVRKKSGELVKPALRPSSRRRYSSMPGTPTYHKSVHFNESNNQTRHFLQVDKPMAVSAGTSPVEQYDSETEFPFDAEPEREMRLANFPSDTFERKIKPIRVDRIFLSADRQTLIGVCAVQNISFHKLVVARFTLDYWKTTSEVVAEYNNDPKNKGADGCDHFNFHIKLSDMANVDNKTILLCVRYNVGGQEFWDNNDGGNYQIDFTSVVKKAQQPLKPIVTGLGARPVNAIPRSRHSPTSPRGHRGSLDDDFAARFDTSSTYSFGSPDQLLGESPTSIKLKPRGKRGSLFPTADEPTQPANGLGGRYDFGASLSAALTSAQDKLGRQSGLMNGVATTKGGSYFGPVERIEGPTKADERPDAITTDRPAMGSDQYKDLVQKFCYFTPGTGKGTSSPQPGTLAPKQNSSQQPKSTDGTQESSSASSSSSSSASASPVMDGTNEYTAPTTAAFSPFTSRSGSPAPVTGGLVGERATSPISFGYPYHHNMRDGYLSDSHIPTAIHG